MWSITATTNLVSAQTTTPCVEKWSGDNLPHLVSIVCGTSISISFNILLKVFLILSYGSKCTELHFIWCYSIFYCFTSGLILFMTLFMILFSPESNGHLMLLMWKEKNVPYVHRFVHYFIFNEWTP